MKQRSSEIHPRKQERKHQVEVVTLKAEGINGRFGYFVTMPAEGVRYDKGCFAFQTWAKDRVSKEGHGYTYLYITHTHTHACMNTHINSFRDQFRERNERPNRLQSAIKFSGGACAPLPWEGVRL